MASKLVRDTKDRKFTSVKRALAQLKAPKLVLKVLEATGVVRDLQDLKINFEADEKRSEERQKGLKKTFDERRDQTIVSAFSATQPMSHEVQSILDCVTDMIESATKDVLATPKPLPKHTSRPQTAPATAGTRMTADRKLSALKATFGEDFVTAVRTDFPSAHACKRAANTRIFEQLKTAVSLEDDAFWGEHLDLKTVFSEALQDKRVTDLQSAVDVVVQRLVATGQSERSTYHTIKPFLAQKQSDLLSKVTDINPSFKAPAEWRAGRGATRLYGIVIPVFPEPRPVHVRPAAPAKPTSDIAANVITLIRHPEAGRPPLEIHENEAPIFDSFTLHALNESNTISLKGKAFTPTPESSQLYGRPEGITQEEFNNILVTEWSSSRKNSPALQKEVRILRQLKSLIRKPFTDLEAAPKTLLPREEARVIAVLEDQHLRASTSPEPRHLSRFRNTLRLADKALHKSDALTEKIREGYTFLSGKLMDTNAISTKIALEESVPLLETPETASATARAILQEYQKAEKEGVFPETDLLADDDIQTIVDQTLEPALTVLLESESAKERQLGLHFAQRLSQTIVKWTMSPGREERSLQFATRLVHATSKNGDAVPKDHVIKATKTAAKSMTALAKAFSDQGAPHDVVALLTQNAKDLSKRYKQLESKEALKLRTRELSTKEAEDRALHYSTILTKLNDSPFDIHARTSVEALLKWGKQDAGLEEGEWDSRRVAQSLKVSPRLVGELLDAYNNSRRFMKSLRHGVRHTLSEAELKLWAEVAPSGSREARTARKTLRRTRLLKSRSEAGFKRHPGKSIAAFLHYPSNYENRHAAEYLAKQLRVTLPTDLKPVEPKRLAWAS
jgi:inhibitor of KinA sporulation pathway (predicted exonuclease)